MATKSPPLCCLITINMCCHRRRGGGRNPRGLGGYRVDKGERLERGSPEKSYPTCQTRAPPGNEAAKQTGTGNSCNRLHIFNVCVWGGRAITGDKEGEEKNPHRLYFFHLNCKHLFGCKAYRTFISLLRFGLIMSTPTFRGVGRC